MTLLFPIECATRLLSESEYPTHGDIRLAFLGIQNHLSQLINDDKFSQKAMAELIYLELSNYWPIMDESSRISSLLDPRTRLSAFKNEDEGIKAKDLVLNLTGYTLTTPTPTQNITTANDGIDEARIYFRKLRNNNSSSHTLNSPNSTIRSELEKYLEIPEGQIDDSVDPLLWWKAQQGEYPILSRVARDYLCIQATSRMTNTIPIRTDTHRARLCLKNWFHKNIC